jgi:hypothetical protein
MLMLAVNVHQKIGDALNHVERHENAVEPTNTFARNGKLTRKEKLVALLQPELI